MKTLIISFSVILLFFANNIFSQTTVIDTLKREAPVFYDVNGNQVTFGAEMPPLNQIGAIQPKRKSYTQLSKNRRIYRKTMGYQ